MKRSRHNVELTSSKIYGHLHNAEIRSHSVYYLLSISGYPWPTNTNEKREQALTVGPLDFSAWPAQHSFSFVQRAAKVEIALFRNKTSLEPGDKWIQEHYADK